MNRPVRIALAGLASLALAGGGLWMAREPVAKKVVELLPMAYSAAAGPLEATITGNDIAREHVAVDLLPVATGTIQPTDVQFTPDGSTMLVLEKKGKLRWFSTTDESSGVVTEIPVKIASEEGLLGLVLHPAFEDNGLFYLNYVIDEGGEDVSVVEEWTSSAADMRGQVSASRRILSLVQPYANHDAGQLQFGPDGMLYIGWGDGGLRNDPKGSGQDRTSWLGAMLRVDVDHPTGNLPYSIPADNPFLSDPDTRPEIWAYGLRNPWRYSFSPDGRLVMADVGQDLWEEISIVPAGGNMGWNVREGFHCFPPEGSCPGPDDLIDPIYEYGRDEGNSITGGYVDTSGEEKLNGLYIFGDFVTGRLWAIDLPQTGAPTPRTLGRWPILPSTFGRDTLGRVYVADFGSGTIYRVQASGS
ncbi:MAG: PQQ-dependent sugar dehydrogenase [Proteobacteria bacterium]|nr:PQQ-dependent sugar dehydrogenase [Pseudomonadota bacterium]MCP4915517.1 PQQ-dependent sugar dehydrogenase [Pseudomonadota bacterium]